MQPEPIVNLNNECLQLSDMVEEAEMEVLSQLTSEVAEYGSQLLEVITQEKSTNSLEFKSKPL